MGTEENKVLKEIRYCFLLTASFGFLGSDFQNYCLQASHWSSNRVPASSKTLCLKLISREFIGTGVSKLLSGVAEFLAEQAG